MVLMINRMYADNSRSAASLFREAVIAQLVHVQDEIAYYLPHEDPPDWRPAGLMPHEWGSIDTYDDFRNGLRLASALLEAILDAPQDEAEQREELRDLIREHGNPLVLAPRLEELVFPGMSSDEVSDWFYEERS